MPAYLSLYQIHLLWPILLGAAVIGGLATGLAWMVLRSNKVLTVRFSQIALVATSFSLLGLTVGFLSGGSRESILGQVIPASLSLVGALSAYIVAKQTSAQPVVTASAATLALGILVGAFWGAEHRNQIMNSRLTIDKRAHLLRYCLLQQDKVRQYFLISIDPKADARKITMNCEGIYSN